MSIPLDRLYNFLHDIINRDDIQIYRFSPHGSKKLEDLSLIKQGSDYFNFLTKIVMICHDQEPLNFALYDNINQTLQTRDRTREPVQGKGHNLMDLPEYQELLLHMNLGQAVVPLWNLNDYFLLLHSEKNSSELTKYEGRYFIGVYYWSHAIIARDWFRCAVLDPTLNFPQTLPSKDFLIYNRAWTGTREYRLKFAELLVKSNLVSNCQTSFSATDQEQHYKSHQFSNKEFGSVMPDLDLHFEPNTTSSTASADYSSEDYSNTGIEVVLETLFNDSRIHLTEKSLRPIACGKPFMLAATCGSLDYLRSYGFKTFAPYINEAYDTIKNPMERLGAIIVEMQRISALNNFEKQKLYQQLNKIAHYNKERFFSQAFHDYVINEYKENFIQALERLEPERKGRHWLSLRKIYSRTFQESRSLLANSDHVRTRQDVLKCHLWLRNPPKLV